MEQSFLSATILLLLVADPLGNIPIFVASLRGVPSKRRATVILRECLIACAILPPFIFVGSRFMDAPGLSDGLPTLGAAATLYRLPYCLR